MKKRQWFLAFFLLFVLTVCSIVSWLFLRLNQRINSSLEKGWFAPLVEYYTAEEKISLGASLSPKSLRKKLKKRFYIELSNKDSIPSGYFLYQKGRKCEKKIKPSAEQLKLKGLNFPLSAEPLPKEMKHCLWWRDLNTNDFFSVSFINNTIYSLQKNHESVDSLILKPFLFAQYENGEPVLRQFKPLSAFPFYCLQSVLTAEDHQFITHEGISLKAIMRAIWKNMRAGQLAEGGSTITQQLIKNIFFSHKKSFWRKFKEQIMALLLETKLSKDEILTAYLNVVYMGQSGTFRIHGFGSAAEYYLNKPLSQLTLGECALLAGLIKSPGRYKPSADNIQILHRRNHILNTLYEKQIINKKELDTSKSQAIKMNIQKYSSFVYFTDTVYKKIIALNLPVKEGLKVFTTLYPDFQEKADQSIKNGLKWLEKNRLKESLKTHSLQAALVSVNVATGSIRAIVGGRNFKASQFNRAIQAQRQIGSLIKPVVVLSALVKDPSLNPLSVVEDIRFEHKYDGSRLWSPKNYKDDYKGKVPLYKALTLSLNAGTARLGLQTGLEPLVQTLQALGGGGFSTTITPHPSLVLGALEMSPWEVAQMFLTIANMGRYKKQHIIRKVTDLKNNILYECKEKAKPALNPNGFICASSEDTHALEKNKKPPQNANQRGIDENKTAILVGMLKEVTKTGTAQWLKNFPIPSAGKTGTTNEEKDAWFVGFTPEFLTVIWVGFDNNQTHYLSGAQGALPLWESFMKKILPYLSPKDFHWPKGVIHRTIQTKQKDSKKDQTTRLVFEF